MSDENDIWDEMADTMRRGLESAGYEHEQAARQAEIAVSALNASYGGTRIGYMPKKRKAVIAEAMKRFNGRNGSQIANELGVHRATVYRQMARILTRKRQIR